MADPPVDITEDLYALVVYLHVQSNRDLLDAIAREELSFSQLQLLEHLRGGRLSPTIREAATLMHVTPAGASRIVQNLARRGLVRRVDDENDYRQRRLVITERGEEAIMRLHAARAGEIAAFNQRLTPEERDQLQTALRALTVHDEINAYKPKPLAA